ncbi:MAG: VOC family protein [Opitutaceae bacterium]|jgi:predicted enzyme related to lactoylglutathione lyase
MKHVTEIAFTGYPVTDMARARAFYEGVLALSPSSTFENEGKQWIEYDIGSSTLAISNMAPKWKPSSDGPAIAFEVSDFDATIAALRAAGVGFPVEPMNSPACRMAVVSDPDGNSVCIHKRAGAPAS